MRADARRRILASTGLLVALWGAGILVGMMQPRWAGDGIAARFLVDTAYAQPGAQCRVSSNFDNNTTQGWTTTNVDPVSGVRPGGSTIPPPSPSLFYYHLKDASGGSTLNAPAPFLGNLVAGLQPGCRREFCFDVNLFNDGDGSGVLHPSFPASFVVYGAGGYAQFVSTTMISETGGANPGWHRICASIQTVGPADPLPPDGWVFHDTTGAVVTPTPAQWNGLMMAATAIRFPVDWGSALQLEEVGYDNFCVRDTCECIVFGQTKVECLPGPSGPSGCYTVTTTVTNNTGQTAYYVMLAPTTAGATVTPNVIPLIPPLLTTDPPRPISFTYCPPASSTTPVGAIDISLAGKDGSPCCKRTLRFDLPPCPKPECLWVPKYKTACVPGAPAGTFTLWFNYRNMTACGTSLFLIPDPPATLSQSYFPGLYSPYVGPGPTYNIPSSAAGITVTGATSSTFCMIISQQCREGGNCCSRRVCFTVPICGPEPLPSPSPTLAPPPHPTPDPTLLENGDVIESDGAEGGQ